MVPLADSSVLPHRHLFAVTLGCMTNSAQHDPSGRRAHPARTAALVAGVAAVLGAGAILQRHRDELTTLGQQHGVPASPQT